MKLADEIIAIVSERPGIRRGVLHSMLLYANRKSYSCGRRLSPCAVDLTIGLLVQQARLNRVVRYTLGPAATPKKESQP